ncbi:MAG TPA: hypothetical protein VFP84_37530 [Kofleriaceae bacterium]|nr:hypothetical protein [Kofleriaceae bacterium]
MVIRALAIAALLVGCGTFQDPNVVVDLRVLAVQASPPDQVIDIDITKPPSPADVLAQLVTTQVCALVADPGADRRLTWQMSICPFGANATGERCADPAKTVVVAAGSIDDPDTTVPQPMLCGAVPADASLLGVLLDALADADFGGLGGIDYNLELRVSAEGAPIDDPDTTVFTSKTLRVVPRIPATITANHNPTIDHVDMAIAGRAGATALPLQRCVENPAPPEVPPATKIRLTPAEPDGARETYVAATIDGKGQTFTESLTYQWTASAGSFSKGKTGGPHQLSGQPAPLFTDFKTPAAGDLDGPTDLTIWIVQRDERLGVQWYEGCVRAMPAPP